MEGFVFHTVEVDLREWTVATLKAELKMEGPVICGGEILADDAKFSTWFDGKTRIVALDCGEGFSERLVPPGPPGAPPPNILVRLLHAGFLPEVALAAISRSHWLPGFESFAASASALRQLVDSPGVPRSPHPAGWGLVPCVDVGGLLGPVGGFAPRGDAGRATVLLPAAAAGGDPGEIPFVVAPARPPGRNRAGGDVRQEAAERAAALLEHQPLLDAAAACVVRLFALHPLSSPSAGSGADAARGALDPRLRVVAHTAFFISPRVLVTSAAAGYAPESASYAARWEMCRSLHAPYAAVAGSPAVVAVRPIDAAERLAAAIRAVGVALPDDSALPPGGVALPWRDALLLEVPPEAASPVWLTPAAAPPAEPRTPVACVWYPSRPSPAWVKTALRDGALAARDGIGALAPLVPLDGDMYADLFCCGWDSKAVSVGVAPRGSADSCSLPHTCTIGPGALGAPILSLAPPAAAAVAAAGSVGTFCGVVTAGGWADATLSEPHDVRNAAWVPSAAWFVLMYSAHILPTIPREDAAAIAAARAFLAPHALLLDPARLGACHGKMLRDADDANEYGMDLYERAQLADALITFRHGAKLFSVARIPSLSEYEEKLRLALAANVASVVMQLSALRSSKSRAADPADAAAA